MIILGIDPGTASMGYSIVKLTSKGPVLKDFGVIKTLPDVVMHKRLEILYTNLDDLAKKYSPDVLVIESLFFNTNTKTAMTVGQARGISMLIAAQNNADVVEYTALQVKRVITGYGRADKKQMQIAVKNELSLIKEIKSDDANDAVALALCYCKKLNNKDE